MTTTKAEGMHRVSHDTVDDGWAVSKRGIIVAQFFGPDAERHARMWAEEQDRRAGVAYRQAALIEPPFTSPTPTTPSGGGEPAAKAGEVGDDWLPKGCTSTDKDKWPRRTSDPSSFYELSRGGVRDRDNQWRAALNAALARAEAAETALEAARGERKQDRATLRNIAAQIEDQSPTDEELAEYDFDEAIGTLRARADSAESRLRAIAEPSAEMVNAVARAWWEAEEPQAAPWSTLGPLMQERLRRAAIASLKAAATFPPSAGPKPRESEQMKPGEWPRSTSQQTIRLFGRTTGGVVPRDELLLPCSEGLELSRRLDALESKGERG